MRSKYEAKAQKELETEGYHVDNKAGMARFAKNRDFFNLFDLVCVKKGEALRWISIKGHAGVPDWHRKELEEFWLPEGSIKEVWYWPNNKKKKQWIKKIVP